MCERLSSEGVRGGAGGSERRACIRVSHRRSRNTSNTLNILFYIGFSNNFFRVANLRVAVAQGLGVLNLTREVSSKRNDESLTHQNIKIIAV